MPCARCCAIAKNEKNENKFCRFWKKSYFCNRFRENETLSNGVMVAHLTLDQPV